MAVRRHKRSGRSFLGRSFHASCAARHDAPSKVSSAINIASEDLGGGAESRASRSVLETRAEAFSPMGLDMRLGHPATGEGKKAFARASPGGGNGNQEWRYRDRR